MAISIRTSRVMHDAIDGALDRMTKLAPETARAYVKEFHDIQDAYDAEREITNHGATAGWSKGGHFMHVGQVPQGVGLFLERMYPEVLRDPKKLHAFLDRYPLFKTTKCKEMTRVGSRTD